MNKGAPDLVLDRLWNDILADLEMVSDTKVLGLGSGTEGLVRRIKDKHFQVETVVEDCFEFLQNSQENSYDAVITAFLLSFVKPDKLFEMTKRVIRPGGKYVILTTEREGWGDFEGEVWKFLVTHMQYLDLLKAFNLAPPFAPRLRQMDKSLRQNGFINIRIENKLIELPFADPVAWLKWLDGVGIASNYIRLVREGQEDFILDEVIRYSDRNKLTCYGVPIEYGKPFTFRWKILYTTAER